MAGAFPIATAKFEIMGIKSIQNTIVSKSINGKKLSRTVDNQRFGFTQNYLVKGQIYMEVYGIHVKQGQERKFYNNPP